jgi:hypothetical protein
MKNLDIEKIGTDLVIAYEKAQGREPFRPKYKGCGWTTINTNRSCFDYQ